MLSHRPRPDSDRSASDGRRRPDVALKWTVDLRHSPLLCAPSAQNLYIGEYKCPLLSRGCSEAKDTGRVLSVYINLIENVCIYVLFFRPPLHHRSSLSPDGAQVNIIHINASKLAAHRVSCDRVEAHCLPLHQTGLGADK